MRHTFASLARTADVPGFLVGRAMGHVSSELVDRVYADALPSGMAHLAERVAGRVRGTSAGLRVIRGGKGKDQPTTPKLDSSPASLRPETASV